MTENMKKFLEIVSTDEENLRAFKDISKLEGDEAKKAITKFAGERGILLVEADFVPDEPPTGELSDDELEAVAGGGTCACVAVGGGKKDKDTNDKACACVGSGLGDGGSFWRCVCLVTGAGT